MKKAIGRSIKTGRFVIERKVFAKISEIEGLPITPTMLRDFEMFDAQQLSHAERRAAIAEKYGKIR